MEVDRLRVGSIDLQRPLAVGRPAELVDDRGAERREQFFGDVTLDVADEMVNQPGRLASC